MFLYTSSGQLERETLKSQEEGSRNNCKASCVGVLPGYQVLLRRVREPSKQFPLIRMLMKVNASFPESKLTFFIGYCKNCPMYVSGVGRVKWRGPGLRGREAITMTTKT